jgi:hypothetical protein
MTRIVAAMTVLAIILFLSALPLNTRRGSLVVVMVSLAGDYVVVGAESRTIWDPQHVDNHGCKIISLGPHTLFLETGHYLVGLKDGSFWKSKNVARGVYRNSKKRDARDLSISWGDEALKWFQEKPPEILRRLRDKDGRIATGGFVNFRPGGFPSVQNEVIYFSDSSKILTAESDEKPLVQGGVNINAIGISNTIAMELFNGTTKRGMDALGPVGTTVTPGKDYKIDSDLVRKSIQFAIDNSTPEDKDALADPIDIAVVRKNRPIEWVSRKQECYKQDQQ